MPDEWTRAIDDGRVVCVAWDDAVFMWTVQLDDAPARTEVGWPLNSVIASVIGYDVAHEDSPAWVDEWATEIQREFQAGRPP